MKTLNQFLLETTVPEELRSIPHSWDHHSKVSEVTKDKIFNAMNGRSFVHFPLDTSETEPDVDVLEHLNKHGWDVHDYAAGMASKVTQVGDPSRGIPMRDKTVHRRISQVLEDTGAPEEVKNFYQNDPARASAKTKGHHVVISTSPLAIAGCSTGTNWTSCMNLYTGSQNHFLRHDSEHGTHVAYLVPHDDEGALKYGEPDKPIGRVSLRPFHSESGDTIFRPAHADYGNVPDSFKNALHNWSVNAYPSNENETYKLNDYVYQGDDVKYQKEPSLDQIKRNIDNGKVIEGKSDWELNDYVMPTKTIDAAIDYAKEKHSGQDYVLGNLVRKFASLPNLTTSHVLKLGNITKSFKEPDSAADITLATNHGNKYSSQMLNDYLDRYGNKSNSFTQSMLQSPKLTSEMIDMLSPAKYHHVRKSLLQPRHIDKLVDHYINKNPNIPIGDFADRLSEDHITKILKAGDDKSINDGYNFLDHSVDALMHSPNFTKQHFSMGMAGYASTRKLMGESKHATVDYAKYGNSLSALMQNHNIPDEEAKRVKDEFIDRVKNISNPEYKTPLYSIKGMDHENDVNRKFIRPHISKHMTEDDYQTLASKNVIAKFSDAKHSNRFLDAIENHIKKTDSDLTDFVKNKKSIDSSYNPEEDDEYLNKKENLMDKINVYHNNMVDHNSTHTISYVGQLKNMDEHEKMLDRTNRIYHSLNNYKPSYNGNDEHHYESRFGDMLSDMDTAYHNRMEHLR